MSKKTKEKFLGMTDAEQVKLAAKLKAMPPEYKAELRQRLASLLPLIECMRANLGGEDC